MTTTPVALLNSGDFFDLGMVVSVHRPFLDDLSKPVTRWEVEYVASPEPNAPVQRVRYSRDAEVEAW